MIRPVRPPDHPGVDAINRAAFGGPEEAEIVSRLRADGDAVLERVADDGGVAGHIMFSRLGADRPGLYAALAPLAVRPDVQRCGIGGALVRDGLRELRRLGARAVIVLGHPDYYPRFGFSAAAALGIEAPFSGLPAFMALALEAGALDGPLKVTYPAAFGPLEGYQG